MYYEWRRGSQKNKELHIFGHFCIPVHNTFIHNMSHFKKLRHFNFLFDNFLHFQCRSDCNNHLVLFSIIFLMDCKTFFINCFTLFIIKLCKFMSTSLVRLLISLNLANTRHPKYERLPKQCKN